jgi:hypothetical protein
VFFLSISLTEGTRGKYSFPILPLSQTLLIFGGSSFLLFSLSF